MTTPHPSLATSAGMAERARAIAEAGPVRFTEEDAGDATTIHLRARPAPWSRLTVAGVSLAASGAVYAYSVVNEDTDSLVLLLFTVLPAVLALPKLVKQGLWALATLAVVYASTYPETQGLWMVGVFTAGMALFTRDRGHRARQYTYDLRIQGIRRTFEGEMFDQVTIDTTDFVVDGAAYVFRHPIDDATVQRVRDRLASLFDGSPAGLSAKRRPLQVPTGLVWFPRLAAGSGRRGTGARGLARGHRGWNA